MPKNSTTESPLRRVRRELAVSQTDMATLCRVSSHTITVTEQGGAQHISAKILSVLEELGYDPAALVEEHSQFMASRRDELLKRLKAKRGKG